MRNSEKFDDDPFTGEIRQIMNSHGHETPSSEPVAVPMGMKRPETLQEQIRRLVRSEQFIQEREALGEETFDEADDFEVGDDFDPFTPYETFFDPVLNREVSPAAFERNQAGYIKRYQKAHERLEEQIGEGPLEDNILRAKARLAKQATLEEETPAKSGGKPESKPPA